MKLHAPKNVTFWISVVLAVLGILGLTKILNLGVLEQYSWLLLIAAYVLLLLGVLVKGM